MPTQHSYYYFHFTITLFWLFVLHFLSDFRDIELRNSTPCFIFLSDLFEWFYWFELTNVAITVTVFVAAHSISIFQITRLTKRTYCILCSPVFINFEIFYVKCNQKNTKQAQQFGENRRTDVSLWEPSIFTLRSHVLSA